VAEPELVVALGVAAEGQVGRVGAGAGEYAVVGAGPEPAIAVEEEDLGLAGDDRTGIRARVGEGSLGIAPEDVVAVEEPELGGAVAVEARAEGGAVGAEAHAVIGVLVEPELVIAIEEVSAGAGIAKGGEAGGRGGDGGIDAVADLHAHVLGREAAVDAEGVELAPGESGAGAGRVAEGAVAVDVPLVREGAAARIGGAGGLESNAGAALHGVGAA